MDVFAALRELRLRLEPQKAAIEEVAIDQVKKPTETKRRRFAWPYGNGELLANHLAVLSALLEIWKTGWTQVVFRMTRVAREDCSSSAIQMAFRRSRSSTWDVL